MIWRHLVWAALVPVVAASVYVVASGELVSPFQQTAELGRRAEQRAERGAGDRVRAVGEAEGTAKRAGRSGEARRPSADEVVEGGSEAAESAGRFVVRALVVVAVVLLAFPAVLTIPRWRARRRRRYGLWRVIPHRGQLASAASMTTTCEEIHAVLSERWWRWAVHGDPAFSVGVANLPDPNTGAIRPELVLMCLGAHREEIEAALRNSYPDIRLERLKLGMELRYIMVLKRWRSFAKGRLPTPVVVADGEEAQREMTIDRVVGAMVQDQRSAIVLYTLRPARGLFERFAHAELRHFEEKRIGEIGGETSSTRSRVTQEELEGAAEGIAHRPLFFGDLRIAAENRVVAEHLAKVIQGATRRGENKLVRRWVRVRRRIYQRRIAHGQPNPLPGFLRSVYSSAELPGLWRVHYGVFRDSGEPMPRLLPPAGMRRVPAEQGMVVAEKGVERGMERGLLPSREDLRANMGILGAINAGKSTAIVRAALALARESNRAVFLCDPKGDATKWFLGALETERPVYVIDFRSPEVGFSPLVGSLPVGKKKAAFVEGIQEMYRASDGDVQTYARSRAYLGVSAEAVMQMVKRPWMDDMNDVLSMTRAGQECRAWLAQNLSRDGHSRYLVREFREQIARIEEAPGKLADELGPPRNKLVLLRGMPMRGVLEHPVQLEIAQAIRERAVVVVNGQLGAVDMEPMRGLMTMFLVMLISAVLRQQDIPESERADVALVLDEASFFLWNTYFKDGLATARSAGLSSILAFQHLGQLGRGDDLRWLTSLVRNWLFFRCAEPDARDVANLLQLVNFDGMGPSDETLARLAANPAALKDTRQWWALGTWMVEGQPSPPFTAHTLEVKENTSRMEAHLEAQRARLGARPVGEEELVPPVRAWEEREEGIKAPVPGRKRRAAEREATGDAPSAGAHVDERQETLFSEKDDAGRGGADDGGGEEKKGGGAATAEGMPEGLGGRGEDEAEEAMAGSEEAEEAGARREDERERGGEEARAKEAVVGIAAVRPMPANLAEPGPLFTSLAAYDSPRDILWEPTLGDRIKAAAAELPDARATLKEAKERAGAISEQAKQAGRGLDAAEVVEATQAVMAAEKKVEELKAVARRRIAPRRRKDSAGKVRWTAAIEGAPQPDRRDLEVVKMLVEFGFMGLPQIAARFYPGESTRSVQRKLARLTDRVGHVQRFAVTTPRGKAPALFRASREGFEMLKLATSREGTYLPEDAEWEEDELVVGRRERQGETAITYDARKRASARSLRHDLDVISWALAFADLTPYCVREVIGHKGCWVAPPKRKTKVHGEWKWVVKRAHELAYPGHGRFRELDRAFRAVNPDVAFELDVSHKEHDERFDLLVEYERSAMHNDVKREKLRAYDALLTAWGHEVERYRELGSLPRALFVLPDWEAAYKYAKFADRLVVGIDEPDHGEVRYAGRERMFFTAAALVHQRCLLCYSLAPTPPEVRVRLAANRAQRETLGAPHAGRVVELLPRRLLERPARLK